MKNKRFGIILAIMLSLPTTIWAVDNMPAINENQGQATEEIAETQQLDEDIQTEDIQTSETLVTPYKQPISKKKIIKKFLLAMGGVFVSSLLLYGGLSAYNSVRNGVVKSVKTHEGETSLKTPEDIEEAVKTFLEKTKWV